MTKKELSQLCHLKNEARELNNRIKMLENAATKSPANAYRNAVSSRFLRQSWNLRCANFGLEKGAGKETLRVLPRVCQAQSVH